MFVFAIFLVIPVCYAASFEYISYENYKVYQVEGKNEDVKEMMKTLTDIVVSNVLYFWFVNFLGLCPAVGRNIG